MFHESISDWRPRRTILFAAWAAEEYGLIGSIEWVDQFKKILDQRAVIYINTDPGVIGSLFRNSEQQPAFGLLLILSCYSQRALHSKVSAVAASSDPASSTNGSQFRRR